MLKSAENDVVSGFRLKGFFIPEGLISIDSDAKLCIPHHAKYSSQTQVTENNIKRKGNHFDDFNCQNKLISGIGIYLRDAVKVGAANTRFAELVKRLISTIRICK